MAKSLQDVVQFMHIKATLTAQERVRWLHQLVDTQPKMIEDGLLATFLNQQSVPAVSAVTLTTSIREVINARPIDDRSIHTTTSPTKQRVYLPKEMLLHIASFLNQQSYIQFMRTCRLYFLASHRPNHLRELKIPAQLDNHGTAQLSNPFPSLRSIHIHAKHSFEHLMSIPSVNFHNVVELELTVAFFPSYVGDWHIFTAFVQSDMFVFNEMRSVKLGYFREDFIVRLLSRTPNLINLELRDVQKAYDFDRHEIRELPLRRLRSLHMDNMEYFQLELLNQYHAQLETLSLVYMRQGMMNWVIQYPLTNCEQLRVRVISICDLAPLIQGATNIRRLSVLTTDEMELLNVADTFYRVFEHLMWTNLDYLCVSDPTLCVMEGISRGASSMERKEEFRLFFEDRVQIDTSLDMSWDTVPSDLDVLPLLESMILQLAWKTKRFLFVWDSFWNDQFDVKQLKATCDVHGITMDIDKRRLSIRNTDDLCYDHECFNTKFA